MTGFTTQLADRRVLVVGCGATGVSAAAFAARFGARVRVVDSREQPPQAAALAERVPGASLIVGDFQPAVLEGIETVVVSPGIDLRDPLIAAARSQGLEILGDIEWFARCVDAPVVAITGSNGKSTVTAWTAAVAEAAGLTVAVGGNFGTPALDLLADAIELYVLELSSFQLELTESLAASAAVVLNVSADHIDRHGDIEHYAALKAKIYAGAEAAVLNADDPRVAAMAVGDARLVRFGRDAQADYRLVEREGRAWLARGSAPWLACDELKLAGAHNHLNALAVWALAEALAEALPAPIAGERGIDTAAIRAGLVAFEGLAHRCQTVAERDGVRWINDSKGTNVGAMLAALAGMPAPVILLAGGQAKGADFAPLAELAAAKTKTVILFGEDRERIAAALAGGIEIVEVEDLRAAVAVAAERAVAGDTVLLSPGCASFDQFENYRHRGECFIRAVAEVAA